MNNTNSFSATSTEKIHSLEFSGNRVSETGSSSKERGTTLSPSLKVVVIALGLLTLALIFLGKNNQKTPRLDSSFSSEHTKHASFRITPPEVKLVVQEKTGQIVPFYLRGYHEILLKCPGFVPALTKLGSFYQTTRNPVLSPGEGENGVLRCRLKFSCKLGKSETPAFPINTKLIRDGKYKWIEVVINKHTKSVVKIFHRKK